uniref:Uncharacterized protein n=1 Tax=Anguilla anguilla TaxID=7936 RepID=A0A0E9PR39_ANGAN
MQLFSFSSFISHQWDLTLKHFTVEYVLNSVLT